MITEAAVASIFLVLGTFLGGALGSFWAVVLERTKLGESIVWPPSRCRSCERRLAIWENIPIISYRILQGKCRTCHATIEPQTYYFEFIGAILGGLITYLCEIKWMPI